jgi:hypothetical protein
MESWLLNWTAFVVNNTHAEIDGIGVNDEPEWYSKMFESWKRNSDLGRQIKEKFQVRYKDIDPDTGDITRDELICVCHSPLIAEWVYSALVRDMSLDYDEPNREIYVKNC